LAGAARRESAAQFLSFPNRSIDKGEIPMIRIWTKLLALAASALLCASGGVAAQTIVVGGKAFTSSRS
jgi:hypothetical protein